MPNQPADIQQRIAEIVARCTDTADAHVIAEVLIAELGLTRETTTGYSNRGIHEASRYVTAWSDE